MNDWIVDNFGSVERYKEVAVSDNDESGDGYLNIDMEFNCDGFEWYLGESAFGNHDGVICGNPCETNDTYTNLLSLPSLEDENGNVVPVYCGTTLKRPVKVAYKVYSSNDPLVGVRYQFLLAFKIYILGRMEVQIPGVSKSEIIKEEFTFLYVQSPGQSLTAQKIDTIRGMIRKWKNNEIALKLYYVVPNNGIRIGGGGRNGKFDDIVEYFALKQCYDYIFSHQKLSTLSIRSILKQMTAKFLSGCDGQDKLIPSIDEKDKDSKGYFLFQNKTH